MNLGANSALAVHVVAETIVVGGVVFWLNKRISELKKDMEDLESDMATMKEILVRHDDQLKQMTQPARPREHTTLRRRPVRREEPRRERPQRRPARHSVSDVDRELEDEFRRLEEEDSRAELAEANNGEESDEEIVEEEVEKEVKEKPKRTVRGRR